MVAGEGHPGGWILVGYGIISYPGRQLEPQEEVRELKSIRRGGKETEGGALGEEMERMKQGRSAGRDEEEKRGEEEPYRDRAEQKDTGRR